MTIQEIKSKTILRKYKKVDSWFLLRYSMNLYRGCTHNCVYCDGRSEKYQVTSEFGSEVSVKTNAIEILDKELNPARKRKPIKYGGFVAVGGGVGDSYQPIEKKYELTRNALKLLLKYNLPAQVLTKNTLVERDIDLLKEIKDQKNAIVNMSFSSVDEKICKIFEPGVPLPGKRLKTLEKFKKAGLTCGMYLMPAIPFITDSYKQIENSVKAAKNAGVDYVVFGGMTLKDGKQKDYFNNILNQHYPELYSEYQKIYKPNKWGGPIGNYNAAISKIFDEIAAKYNMPKRIHVKYCKDLLSENELVYIILEQIDTLLQLKGQKSPYSYAAYSILQLDHPVRNIQNNLQSLKGVGNVTEKIIKEILETGTSKYYEKLIIS